MKTIKKVFFTAFLTILAVGSASAQNLGDLLGGDLGNTLGNMLEGVFSSSKLSVSDLEGTWQSSGPAVCFQGEGFLKKAGGLAAASALETKLAPYYQKYGLDNATLTVDNAGNFTLKMKSIKLSGTITKSSKGDGIFDFNFKALGTISLGKITTYVQKSYNSLDVMFDATKLKKLVTTVANFTGISIAKTFSSLLDSYDGLCVGFKMNLVSGGNNSNGLGGLLNGLGIGGSSNSTNSNTNKSGTTNNSNNNGSDAIGTGVDLLRDILKGKK